MKYQLSDEFVWKEIGGQVVVLEFETGAYWSLNQTGSMIWKLLVERCKEQDIVDSVCREFEVEPGVARSDLAEMIQFCLEKKMLEGQ